jgi:hypothetical protein
MKKMFYLLILFAFAGIFVNAQSPKQSPPPPPPKVNMTKFKPPVINESAKEYNEFLRKNPSIANIAWKDSLNVIIKLKNKKIENYNLDVEEEKKIFIKKYGVPLIPPPPPPKSIN